MAGQPPVASRGKVLHRQTFQNSSGVTELIVRKYPKSAPLPPLPPPKPFKRDCHGVKELERVEKENKREAERINRERKRRAERNRRKMQDEKNQEERIAGWIERESNNNYPNSMLPDLSKNCEPNGGRTLVEVIQNKSQRKKHDAHPYLAPDETWNDYLHKTCNSYAQEIPANQVPDERHKIPYHYQLDSERREITHEQEIVPERQEMPPQHTGTKASVRQHMPPQYRQASKQEMHQHQHQASEQQEMLPQQRNASERQQIPPQQSQASVRQHIPLQCNQPSERPEINVRHQTSEVQEIPVPPQQQQQTSQRQEMNPHQQYMSGTQEAHPRPRRGSGAQDAIHNISSRAAETQENPACSLVGSREVGDLGRLVSDDVNSSPFGESGLQILNQVMEQLRARGDSESSNLMELLEAVMSGRGSLGDVGGPNLPPHPTPPQQYPSVFPTPHSQHYIRDHDPHDTHLYAAQQPDIVRPPEFSECSNSATESRQAGSTHGQENHTHSVAGSRASEDQHVNNSHNGGQQERTVKEVLDISQPPAIVAELEKELARKEQTISHLKGDLDQLKKLSTKLITQQELINKHKSLDGKVVDPPSEILADHNDAKKKDSGIRRNRFTESQLPERDVEEERGETSERGEIEGGGRDVEEIQDEGEGRGVEERGGGTDEATRERLHGGSRGEMDIGREVNRTRQQEGNIEGRRDIQAEADGDGHPLPRENREEREIHPGREGSQQILRERENTEWEGREEIRERANTERRGVETDSRQATSDEGYERTRESTTTIRESTGDTNEATDRTADEEVWHQKERKYRAVILHLQTENAVLREEITRLRELIINLEARELTQENRPMSSPSKLTTSAPNLSSLGPRKRSPKVSSYPSSQPGSSESEADSAYEERTGSQLTSKTNSPHLDPTHHHHLAHSSVPPPLAHPASHSSSYPLSRPTAHPSVHSTPQLTPHSTIHPIAHPIIHPTAHSTPHQTDDHTNHPTTAHPTAHPTMHPTANSTPHQTDYHPNHLTTHPSAPPLADLTAHPSPHHASPSHQILNQQSLESENLAPGRINSTPSQIRAPRVLHTSSSSDEGGRRKSSANECRGVNRGNVAPSRSRPFRNMDASSSSSNEERSRRPEVRNKSIQGRAERNRTSVQPANMKESLVDRNWTNMQPASTKRLPIETPLLNIKNTTDDFQFPQVKEMSFTSFSTEQEENRSDSESYCLQRSHISEQGNTTSGTIFRSTSTGNLQGTLKPPQESSFLQGIKTPRLSRNTNVQESATKSTGGSQVCHSPPFESTRVPDLSQRKSGMETDSSTVSVSVNEKRSHTLSRTDLQNVDLLD